MFSIIIPVYNVGVYLEKCLSSLQVQTYRDFEVILVDDGSTDDSGAICDRFAGNDSRFKVFHRQNAGVSAARNFGLTKVIGRWLTFIDSDDWVSSNYLETLMTPPPISGSVVFAPFSYEYGNFSKIVDYKIGHANVSEKDLSLLSDNHFLHNGMTCGKRYDAQMIRERKIIFNVHLPLHEDHVFFFDYIQNCSDIFFVDQCFYYYRRALRQNSLSGHLPTNWQSLNLASRLFIERYPLIEKRFPNMSTKYLNDAKKQYGLVQLFMALNAMYELNEDRNRRIEQINLIKRIVFKENKDAFKATYLRAKILSFMICFCPVVMSDYMLHIVKCSEKQFKTFRKDCLWKKNSK